MNDWCIYLDNCIDWCICLENWIYYNALPTIYFFYNGATNMFTDTETNSETSEECEEILDWEVMENSKSGF